MCWRAVKQKSNQNRTHSGEISGLSHSATGAAETDIILGSTCIVDRLADRRTFELGIALTVHVSVNIRLLCNMTWHFRLPLPIQMFIKVASSPRLSGIGMPSPILWSHPLKMQRIVLLSSLLWWELGTNSLITGPGEWLSFRRFTSKLSWLWSWLCIGRRYYHEDFTSKHKLRKWYLFRW